MEQEIRYCTSFDGTRIAYATLGDRSNFPLVRVATWLTHLEFDFESPIWRPWLKELGRNFFLVRYDPRGCGLSDWNTKEISFSAWVRDLEEVVNAVGLDRFVLLGLSQGGPIGIEYSLYHPDKVKQLILWDAFSVGWIKRGQVSEEERNALLTLTREGWGRNSPAYRSILTNLFIPDANKEQLRWFNELQRKSMSGESAVRYLIEVGNIDITKRLPEISVPTLVLHARGDSLIPYEEGRLLAATIPKARLVTLESRNHIILEREASWSRSFYEIRNFCGIPETISSSVSGKSTATTSEIAKLGKVVNTSELQEAVSLLRAMSVVSLSRYRIVGNYFRFEEDVRNGLKDVRQRILAAFESSALKRENYLLWAPPGSGKTFFVQQVASSLKKDNIGYRELNLAQTEEAGLRLALEEIRKSEQPFLCLIDEIDAKLGESWPYEVMLPYMDAAASRGGRCVFITAGSSGSSLSEMKKGIASRPKGADLLSRIPWGNEYSVPPMSFGDRILVTLSQFIQTSKGIGRDVTEVEKMALLYITLNPKLSSARQLSEFAVRCVERMQPSDDRIKYDNLFDPGNPENKAFWMKTHVVADQLVNSFIALGD